MKVSQLKRILEYALERLEDYEGDEKIEMQSNTYFVKNAKMFVGCNEGYFDLENIEVEFDDDRCESCKGQIEWNEDGTAGICSRCGEEY